VNGRITRAVIPTAKNKTRHRGAPMSGQACGKSSSGLGSPRFLIGAVIITLRVAPQQLNIMVNRAQQFARCRSDGAAASRPASFRHAGKRKARRV
jgi:hypothetical protein